MAVSCYFKTVVIHSDTNIVIALAIRASEQIFRIKSAKVDENMNVTFTFASALLDQTYLLLTSTFLVIVTRSNRHVHGCFKVHHILWGQLCVHGIHLTSLCCLVIVYAFTFGPLFAEYHARFDGCEWFGGERVICQDAILRGVGNVLALRA